MAVILRCALCGRTGLDVESRIVADESPLGYHREPRCVDQEACEGRVERRRGELAIEEAFTVDPR